MKIYETINIEFYQNKEYNQIICKCKSIATNWRHIMSEIKLDIISGFLGAGKTTLIKKLINNEFKDEKIAIIENEFGEISIDGDLLKENNIDIKEINSGCICCSLIGDFKESIKEIINFYSPQRILIEPSGVAKLSDVIKACTSIKEQCRFTINIIATIIDILNAKMYINNFGEFYKDQIKNAKIIILTRIENSKEDDIKEIMNLIKGINSDAIIITQPLDEIDLIDIANNMEKNISIYDESDKINESERNNLLKVKHSYTIAKKLFNSEDKEEKVNNGFKIIRRNNLKEVSYMESFRKHINHINGADNEFNTWGLETEKKFDEIDLKNIFKDISKNKIYGNVIRGKGIVKSKDGAWIQFNYTPGQLKINNTKGLALGKICIIGRDINKDKLNYLFQI